MKNKKPKSSLEVVFERYEGGCAVMRLEDGQEIFWPKINLPRELQKKDKLFLMIKSKEEYEQDSNDLAKNILHQILNGKEKS
ncbi:MAG: hypothetical protein WCW17_01020 [Patescibacteria group bacterium]